MLTSTGPLRIGGNAIWGEYFSGLIDEVRIYNRALSQAEIQAEMNAPVGTGRFDASRRQRDVAHGRRIRRGHADAHRERQRCRRHCVG